MTWILALFFHRKKNNNKKFTQLKKLQRLFFSSQILKLNIPDIFSCSAVENRGILLSNCYFCMSSPSHGHEDLFPVTNPVVISIFHLLVWTSDICGSCYTVSAETLKAAASRTTLFSTMAFKLVLSDCSYVFAEEKDGKDIQGRMVQGFGCFITDNSWRNCLL